MARIVESITFGVTRNEAGKVTAVRYFTPSPLFGQAMPEKVDAMIIDNNGPWWLGHTVNLDIDGDEVVLNCQMGPDLSDRTRSHASLLTEMAECIRASGVIELSEQVMCPDDLEYRNRVHQISATHYDSDLDFVLNYRAEDKAKVY